MNFVDNTENTYALKFGKRVAYQKTVVNIYNPFIK